MYFNDRDRKLSQMNNLKWLFHLPGEYLSQMSEMVKSGYCWPKTGIFMYRLIIKNIDLKNESS